MIKYGFNIINKKMENTSIQAEVSRSNFEGTPKLHSFVACFAEVELYVGVLCEKKEKAERE